MQHLQIDRPGVPYLLLCNFFCQPGAHPLKEACEEHAGTMAGQCIHPCEESNVQGGHSTAAEEVRLPERHREPSVEMSALGHTMVAALYNPLAWPRSEGIRVPLNTSSSKSWTVRGV